MCISKRFQSTGATGGHGMQEIDVLKRRMLEDKFDQESSEMSCICGNGCEFTILGDAIPLREALILGDYIHANNLCPFCKTKEGSINFEYCVENHNKMQPYSFVMNDKRYDTMYKPAGYKFLPPSELDEQE